MNCPSSCGSGRANRQDPKSAHEISNDSPNEGFNGSVLHHLPTLNRRACKSYYDTSHTESAYHSPRSTSSSAYAGGAVWTKDGRSAIRHVSVSLATSRCSACNSECDWNCTHCEICGEPFEEIPFERIRNVYKARNLFHMHATPVASPRRSNLICRECNSVFSAEAEVCPICGEHNEKLATPIIWEEPARSFDWVRSKVKVRSPSGAAASRAAIVPPL